MARRLLRTFLVAAVLGIAVGLLVTYYHRSQPLYTTGSDVPDPARVGHPEFALAKGQAIYTAYRQAGGDVARIPFSLCMLPDQKYAETAIDRNPQTTAWEFPRMPEYKDVLCYTDLYARANRSYYRGDTAKAHPTGYFIVVWKSGKVEKVPVAALRMIATKQGLITAFPGMPGYATGQPHVKYRL